jgi:hypothetical protein
MVNFTPWRKQPDGSSDAGAISSARREKDAGAPKKWSLGILSAETDEVPGKMKPILAV